MKKIIILSLFLSSLVAGGQQYHKLINESLYWDVPYAEMGYICMGYGPYGPWRYKFSGDTIINEKVYAKLYASTFISLNPQPAPNCPPFVIDTLFYPVTDVFLREDTVEKKVWRYTTINTPEEILLYDFSVEKGDTLDWDYYPPVVVDSIYNIVTFDGITRKKIEYGTYSWPWGFYIEGIGGVAGLMWEPIWGFEGGPWLQCVHDLDENVIWNDYNTCYNFITDVTLITDESSVCIYPNPVKGKTLYVKSPEGDHGDWQADISDLYGRVLLHVQIEYSVEQLHLPDLAPGIYTIEVYNKQQIFLQKKILKI